MNSAASNGFRVPIASVLRRLGWLAVAFGLAAQAHAGGLVSSLTEAALRAALTNGGPVTFSVAGTITLSAPLVITNATTIDGGGQVKLSGGGSTQLFRVVSNLTLLNLTLAAGRATNGGGLFVAPGATVLATNCEFSSHIAVGTNGVDGADGADSSGIAGNGRRGTDGGGALGGAIFSQGQLQLFACRFLTNQAIGGDGGRGGNGGNGGVQGGDGGRGGNGGTVAGAAVYASGTLIASNCAFAGNMLLAGDAASGGAGGSGPFRGLHGNGGAGGGASGAAVCAQTHAVVVGCTFEGNHAGGGHSAAGGEQANGAGANGAAGGDAAGGGLWSGGSGQVTNCTFASNTTTGGDGGDGGDGTNLGGNGGRGGYGFGGNVCNVGTLHVVNCTLTDGSSLGGFGGLAGTGPFPGSAGSDAATRGGNIANVGGVFTLKNSILAYPASGTNSFTVTNIVTTTTNWSVSYFVPVTNSFLQPDCPQEHRPECMTNVVYTVGTTVITNLLLHTNGPCFTLTNYPHCFTNIVFTNQVVSNYSAEITVTNIVSGTNIAAALNAYGTITDAGHNLSSDTTAAVSSLSRSITDPKLGPLADNGGPTRTRLPLAGSPALNAGDDAACPLFDQRGVPRPSGTHSDIGAVEVRASTSTAIQSPVLRGTNFSFLIPSEVGRHYAVEFKSALSDSAWTRLAFTPGSGSWLTNTFSTSAATNRFFRVVIE